MTQSTSRGHHRMDGWMPWAIIMLSIAVVLMPNVPFPGYSAALAALGVTAYLLGRRHVERQMDELIATGQRLREESERRQEVIDRMARTPERKHDY